MGALDAKAEQISRLLLEMVDDAARRRVAAPSFVPAGESVPIRDRGAVTVKIGAEFLGIGVSTLYAMASRGEVESVMVAGRRLILVRSLLKLLGEDEKATGSERQTA